MKDYYLFAKRFFSDPATIGSICPSSKKLARQMIKKTCLGSYSAQRYLEVGAGSGAVTKHMVKQLNPHDTLDIVELDPHLCSRLQCCYGHLPNVAIHEMSILDFEHEDFDCVISSLPLNAFDSGLVDKILLKYKNLVKSGGFISYFEYIGLGKIKSSLLSGSEQADFKTTLSLKDSFTTNYCTEVDKIWWNLPPARVFHCQL